MKGIIKNLATTEKLYIFDINGQKYATKKEPVSLIDGIEIEFKESVTKGKQKSDGTYWPDTQWANEIVIIGDADEKKVTQFRADPAKQNSIERQSAIKSAVEFYAQRGQATPEDVLNAAKLFINFINGN